jgi:hypothetical protein
MPAVDEGRSRKNRIGGRAQAAETRGPCCVPRTSCSALSCRSSTVFLSSSFLSKLKNSDRALAAYSLLSHIEASAPSTSQATAGACARHDGGVLQGQEGGSKALIGWRGSPSQCPRCAAAPRTPRGGAPSYACSERRGATYAGKALTGGGCVRYDGGILQGKSKQGDLVRWRAGVGLPLRHPGERPRSHRRNARPLHSHEER